MPSASFSSWFPGLRPPGVITDRVRQNMVDELRDRANGGDEAAQERLDSILRGDTVHHGSASENRRAREERRNRSKSSDG